MDDQKQPWGPVRHMTGTYAPYHTLAIAVVEQAMQDLESAAKAWRRNPYIHESGELITRAKRAWAWLTDDSVVSRLPFRTVCDGTGLEHEIAIEALITRVKQEWGSDFLRLVERPIVVRPDIGKRKPKVEVSGG